MSGTFVAQVPNLIPTVNYQSELSLFQGPHKLMLVPSDITWPCVLSLQHLSRAESSALEGQLGIVFLLLHQDLKHKGEL